MPLIHWNDGHKGRYRPRKTRPGSPEFIVSHHNGTQGQLRKHARRIYMNASALHSAVQGNDPRTSSTSIGITGPNSGRWLDYTIHLYSERGAVAATAIEFGHTGIGVSPGSSIYPFQQEGRRYEGAFILHRAAGLPIRRRS